MGITTNLTCGDAGAHFGYDIDLVVEWFIFHCNNRGNTALVATPSPICLLFQRSSIHSPTALISICLTYVVLTGTV